LLTTALPYLLRASNESLSQTTADLVVRSVDSHTVAVAVPASASKAAAPAAAAGTWSASKLGLIGGLAAVCVIVGLGAGLGTKANATTAGAGSEGASALEISAPLTAWFKVEQVRIPHWLGKMRTQDVAMSADGEWMLGCGVNFAANALRSSHVRPRCRDSPDLSLPLRCLSLQAKFCTW
jgi:hypothetical protein